MVDAETDMSALQAQRKTIVLRNRCEKTDPAQGTSHKMIIATAAEEASNLEHYCRDIMIDR